MGRALEIEDVYPLAPIQHGILFHSLYEPEAGEYYRQLVFAVRGPLEESVFRRTWQEVVDRHSILRTAFVWDESDEPYQVVCKGVELPLDRLDWRGTDPAEQKRQLTRLLATDRERGVDLSATPLMRMALVRLGEEEWNIVWSFHHLLLDGWSVALVLRRAFAAYRALSRGDRVEVEPSRPYRDYVAWLLSQDAEAAEAFWSRKLAGVAAAEPLDLGGGSAGGGTTEERVSRDLLVHLGSVQTAALERCARRARITLNTLVQGVWALTLARLAGGPGEVVFGATSAGRPTELQGFEQMVGLFINTLPVRVPLPPSMKLAEWLRDLQSAQTEARRYEYAALSQVQRWSGLAAGQALFESIVVFENYRLDPQAAPDDNGLEVRRVEYVDGSSYPLTVIIRPGPDLGVRLVYDASRFSAAAVQRTARAVVEALEAMPGRLGDRLGAIPWLAPAERHQIVHEWNDTEAGYAEVADGSEPGLDELLLAQCRRTPDAVALIHNGGAMTYGELGRRVERLAARLTALGVGVDDLVGLCAVRSFDLLIGVFGILASGAAYVPLDPEYPRRRLAEILEDAAPRAVLHQRRFAGLLPAVSIPALALDAPRPEEVAAADRPDPGAGPGRGPLPDLRLAYTIFTSGSTGRPKGAMNSHRAVRNRVLWMQSRYRLTGGDRVLHKTPFSFDVSVWELIWPLFVGASTVIAAPGGHRDPRYMAELIQRHGVTTVHFVPAMLRVFVAEPESERCPTLRRVIASGEALPEDLVAEFHRGRAGEPHPTELHNLYGPTEAAVDVTSWHCDPGRPDSPVPIGRPIGNVRILIVDRWTRPVAAGVPGELLIGGVAPARGYRARPALTAAAFVPDPTGERLGERLYRTGDLTRLRHDGRIEYLGRIDHQVKIRGLRVELGEIESALLEHPQVRAAVVVAWNDGGPSARLVGYLVVTARIASEELTGFLGGVLPEATIPQLFVFLEEMPLSPNGKVDRKALPAPEEALGERTAEWAPPRDERERTMAAIWAAVLGRDEVGIDDNFFEFGGDSIRSIQVLARARREGVALSLPELFQRPTIRSLFEGGGEKAGPEPAGAAGLPALEPLPEKDRARLPDGVEDAYPLAYMQEGMLFHGELSGAAAMYHDVFSYRYSGGLDVTALRRATEVLSHRHEVLRTSFHTSGYSRSLQLVWRGARIPVEVVDLSALEGAVREPLAARLIAAERFRPFAWTKPPLVRLLVHLLSERDFHLTLSFHHAVLDGWSVAALLTELFQLYLAAAVHEVHAPSVPAGEGVGFRDFVALERAALDSEATASYWTDSLASADRLELPRHMGEAGRGLRVESVDLGDEVSERLHSLAQGISVPVKSVLFAAHYRALTHFGGRRDLVTGLVSNGRPEVEGGDRVLGMFLNSLPLRLRPEPGSWSELVRQVFAVETSALAHRWFPLAEIQRRLGGGELFETVFNFVHFHVREQVGRVVGVEARGGSTFERTNFPLYVNFRMRPGRRRIELDLRCDAARLDATTCRRLADGYRRVLAVMAADPEARWDRFEVSSPGERHQVLREWSDTARELSPPSAVHRAIARRARQRSDAVAVRCGDRHLSYGELRTRFLGVAAALTSAGIGPGHRIALCTSRSPEMVVGVLGILAAGAAYVPLDPGHPPSRLAGTVDDAGVVGILTDEAAAVDLGTVPVRWTVESTARTGAATSGGEGAEPLPGQLAYLIYTSGSTGRPKGVAVGHEALWNFLSSMLAEPGLAEDGRLVAVTTLAFDIAALEIYLPLLRGGTVIVAERDTVAEPVLLARRLAETAADAMQATPATWRMLLDGGWRPGRLEVLCGGEALPPELAAGLSGGEGRDGALWNLYGPTETTVWSAVERIDAGSASIPAPVSVGRPIDNTGIYLADERLDPVPPGTVGELWIGGRGLAHGYHRRPGLTGDRFRPDPFGSRPGARVYRTGDLARWLPDGRIEHLGRIDHQVKVRGFRIETGEVESALLEHPEIATALVTPFEQAGETALAAYLVAAEREGLVGELRARLSERLPDYMQPAGYVFLAELPLNPNGKVDRKALPAPGAAGSQGRPFVAPADPVEEVLAQIYSTVLGVEPVGAADSFLELGGHSLLATRVMARARQALGVELPLAALFDHPVVSDLARAVGELLRGDAEPPPPIEPRPGRRRAPLSFGQERLWFLDRLRPGSAAYNIPLVVDFAGALAPSALAGSLADAVARHSALRTVFRVEDGEPFQEISEEGAAGLPTIDLSALPSACRPTTSERWTRAEQRRPFDLSRGPLLRGALLRLGAERHRLLLTLHHSIVDGWSIRSLLGELSAGYADRTAGRESSVPAPPVQYADYASWQRRWLSEEALGAEVAAWSEHLDGVTQHLPLPTDRPRASVRRRPGGKVRATLPEAAAAELRGLARRHDGSLFMVLLAALEVLLFRLTGERRFNVGTAVAGRGRVELERVIGLFINTLVLRASLDPDRPFAAALADARREVLWSHAHQRVPFEKVVDAVVPVRELSSTALFQVLLLLETERVESPELPGLCIERRSPGDTEAKFDLSLSVRDYGADAESASDAGLGLTLTYDHGLYDETTARRWLLWYLTLLSAVAAAEETAVAELPLLAATERAQALYGWNDVPRPAISGPSTVLDAISARCRERPDAVALVAGGCRWSYRGLWAAAGELASELHRRGVEPGEPVGLCTGRNDRSILGSLGILRAGGAFVPIDPQWPDARRRRLLDATAVRWVVSEERWAGGTWLDSREWLTPTTPRAGTAAGSGPSPEPVPRAGDLAYLVFTSGSTGESKAVAVEHRQLLAYTVAVNERLAGSGGFAPGARLATASALAADLGHTAIFPALCAGGTLHVLAEDEVTDPAAFAAALVREPLDGLKIVPSHLSALQPSPDQAALPDRWLIVGGEAPDRAELTAWRRRRPGLEIVNHYGPTETTVGVLTHRFEPSPVPGSASVPIGRPLPGARAYVLDGRLSPVGIGVTGRLWLGGAGVARGYLGRPGLTADRFRPDPWDEGGARMYDSGDLAYRLADGAVQFAGRADAQLKIRGFRVEPAEVAAALEAHPGVGEAAVTGRVRGGGTGLAGYYAGRGGAEVDPEELRRFVAERLPGAMVPAVLVPLHSLPRLANGKVDLQALPAPDSRDDPGEVWEAPVTEAERRIAARFEELLGRRDVGRRDDFFGLGGHSLTAMRLISRLRQDFDAEIPLAALFEAPAVADLALRVEEALADGGACPVLATPRRMPGPGSEGAPRPLSWSQQRLWFLDRLLPGSAAYNVPVAVELGGELSVAALRAALRAAVQRHEVLRTRYREVGGRPVQIVGAASGVALPQTDLSALPEETAAAESERLIAAHARRPFDLERGPVLRTLLLRLAPRRHRLALTLHHIASDAWSRGILVREIAEGYRRALDGERDPRPPLPLQYSDYALWQRERLEGEGMAEALAWWRRRLSPPPPVLELPADRPHGERRTGRGGHVPVAFDAEVSVALADLARSESATLYMVLLAALQATLGRIARQSDFAVATPVAGRDYLELEGLIGFFVNTLVLRSKLGGGSFRRLLRRVRDGVVAAQSRQEVPFDRLVDELDLPRTGEHQPLSQVVFALQNAERADLRLRGLEVEPLEVSNRAAKFDLTLVLGEHPSGLRGALEYAADRFDETTARRWASHFVTLATAAVRSPDRAISRLPMLRLPETEQVLRQWNDTAGDYPRDATVDERFRRVAEARPDAVAVTAEGSQVSYGTLAQRVSALARRLRQVGVGTEARVGIFLDRSVDLVVALLAVLEAGGVYVPLDPTLPEARVRELIEGAEIGVVVHDGSQDGVWRGGSPRGDGIEIAGVGERAAGIAAQPGSLAYILFTSGSTGRPKGVMVGHRAVVRLIEANRFAELGSEEIYLQLAPVAFDASTLELWAPLTHGGRLELAPPGPLSLSELGDLIQARRVSTLWLTSGLFHQMVEHRLPALAGLSHLLTGGDVVSPAHARKLLRAYPSLRLSNGYGPTENTTFSTVYPMHGPQDVSAGSVPVGRPIGHGVTWVVEPGGAPCPIGVPGELMVGGDGLARGYAEQPRETAERFVPDPFSGRPGERLYRTGDLVRWLPDGRIDFLRRIDRQIKMRGFRIEPGEIEAAMRADPDVREAAVLVHRDPERGPSLTGYVTTFSGAAESAEAVRRGLAERLPAYMVPVHVVHLDSMPLNPNGKIDRQALPSPEAPGPAGGSAPATPLEEEVAAIWRAVLGVEEVTREAEFFELGGHSLLATQVLSRLRDELGIEASLRALFDRPSLEGFCAALEIGGEEAEEPIPAGVRPPGPASAPLSYAQEGIWLHQRLAGAATAYNVPTALSISGALDARALRRAFAEVAGRHDMLRTSILAEGEAAVQVVHARAELPLGVLDLSALPAAARHREEGRLARAVARCPFDLSRAPLWRALAVRSSDERWALLLTCHHLVVDQWSLAVLLREVSTLYAAAARERRAELPPLPIQYADYARWNRGRLDGAVGRELAGYWSERLSGAPERSSFPPDREPPPVQSFAGRRLPLDWPPELSARLAELARGHGATLFMTLLAGMAALLHRHTGATDVTFGTYVANRGRRELEGLVGMFVNTLVLRLEPGPGLPFSEMLRQARRVTVGAFAHQEQPFSRLVEQLAPERSVRHSSLFQVTVELQNAMGPEPEDEVALSGAAPLVSPTNGGRAATRATADLSLVGRECVGGASWSLVYSTALYDATSIERLGRHLGRMLAAASRDPSLRLGELPLLDSAERHQILYEWGSGLPASELLGGDETVSSRTVSPRIGRTCQRVPDRVALVQGDVHLSYGELGRRVGATAARLSAHGVGPEIRVGISTRRSPEMIVGVLGILAAGGCYVPLDGGLPRQRLLWIFEDSAPQVTIGPASERSKLTHGGAAYLDWSVATRPAEAGRPPAPDVSAGLEDPRLAAYVIYTSGSTGKPKGVEVGRGALSAYAEHVVEEFGLVDGERMLQFADLAFDAAGEEIFPSLAAGVTLVLRSDDMLESPATFFDECRRHALTVLAMATTYWGELGAGLDDGSADAVPSLRLLVMGGDKATREQLARWRRGVDRPIRLMNSYGPTEATIVAIGCDLDPRPGLLRAGQVPIGRPVRGVHAEVHDRAGRPVPPGVAGELVLGGVGVARGYQGLPARTAQSFTPDPRGHGDCLYRTGDLVRWRPTGELDFLGRIDHQVKVRGYRIELGEVEAALDGHPAILEAVVLAVRPESAAERLTACIVARPGAVPSPAELRTFLRDRLPAYAVPADFHAFDAFPRTRSDKTDRRALAEHVASLKPSERSAAPAEPPRTPTEELVAAGFAEVLGAAETGLDSGLDTGRDTDFFARGGHSLLAIRLISRLQKRLGVELPLAAVFESPTVAELAERADRELSGGAEPLPPILPVPEAERRIVSFGQRRLWFLARLYPGSPQYNIPLRHHFADGCDPAALRAALSEVVRRHEVLRTVFAEVDEEPVQIVRPASPVALPVVDLRALRPEARRREAERRSHRESRRPFDLEHGPLFRFTLILGPGHSVSGDGALLLATLHHVVADGWSVSLLEEEVEELSTALVRCREPELPALPVQYADYAAWQRSVHREGRLEEALDFWRWELEGLPDRVHLPLDAPRRRDVAGRGGRVTARLDGEPMARLGELFEATGCTPFVGALALFQLLLARLSGDLEVAIGVPTAGRGRPEIEGLIGFFVNVLVLLGDLTGRPSVAEHLERTRRRVLSAFAHREVPLELLVEELAPSRELGMSPLFQVLFSYERSERASEGSPARTADGAVRAAGSGNGGAKFDLSLALRDRGDRWDLSLSYDRALIDSTTAMRWLGAYRALLSAAAAAPAAGWDEVPWIGPGERAQLLYGWNDAAARPHGRADSAVERLRAAVERAPDAVALCCDNRRWSYSALWQAAGRLAGRLRRAGARPGARVALCARRSGESFLGLLAVWRAGAAYLALDPSWPAARKADLLADAGTEMVLVDAVSVRAPFWGSLPTIRLDRRPERETKAAAEPGELPLPPAESLAYVLYTSGSTGRSKGVAVEHRHLLAYALGVSDALGLEPGESMATTAGLAADLGNTAWLAALALGGTLHVLGEEVTLDPERFRQRIDRQRIEALKAVPSHLAALLAGGEGASGLPLRHLIAGGEEAPPADLGRWQRAAPGLALFNHYGPTEATVGVLTHRFDPFRRRRRGRVPLGRPIPGARVYVLDRRLRPSAVGVVGELWLGGGGVSRGYWAQPAASAERFRPDPWGKAGARMYGSGDLARRTADGAVEFLGRADSQLEVRGFRVEPAEVVAVLEAHPGVREAYVTGGVTEAGETEVLAYYAPGAAAEPAPRELRRFVAERLPAAMVPASLVRVKALPRAANGKVDPKALPQPPAGRREAIEVEPPATAAEQQVASLFAELLGVGTVGRHDDFFERGGHSLLAIRLISRLRRDLGAEIPLAALFEDATCSGLATRAEAAGGEAVPGPRVPELGRSTRRGPAPLSFAQERMWFLDRLEPGNATYNVPLAVEVEGLLSRPALAAALSWVVARHEVLRTRYETRGARPVAVAESPAPVPAPAIDLSALPEPRRGEAAERLAAAEAVRPFDLARVPVLRLRVLVLAADRHRLLLTLHHIASDAWSRSILVRELTAAYSELLRNRQPRAPELPVQYGDYAAWQRRWLSGEALEREIQWWRRALTPLPPPLRLPTDRPYPRRPSRRGADCARTVPRPVTRRLLVLAGSERTTLFGLLASAWMVLLARYGAGEDVTLGTPVAGRDRLEVEELIGIFVNTLVLRARVDGEEPFRTLLRRVGRRSVEALAHQSLPFERLVEELAPRRDLAREPLFQTLVVVQNAPARPLRLEGLSLRSLGTRTATAKFELSLVALERDGELRLSLNYATELFDRTTALRLLDHLTALLESSVEDPDRAAGDLTWWDPGQRQQLLHEWQGAALTEPRGRTLAGRVLARAKRIPDAVAAEGRDGQLSYGELERRVLSLAARLVASGVTPEDRVGVMVERGTKLLEAVLGVLAAGAAYVPLDPQYPQERLALMAADAGVSRVMVSERYAEWPGRLEPPAEAWVLGGGREVPPSAAVPIRVPQSALAYVFYTSGSTGRPKGVAVTQRSALALIDWSETAFDPEELDGVVASTSLSFDPSVWELMVPLALGGRMLIVEDALDLATHPAAGCARLLNTVPSALDALLRLDALPPSLSTVSLCGEALPEEVVGRLHRRHPGVPAINLYGPSEDTTYSTETPQRTGVGDGKPTIGRPIAGTAAWVLDRRGRPVPPGVEGELTLSGIGLARGYLGRPARTAASFVPDPFAAASGEAGARMYRTGDRVRWLREGELDFLGRLDHQVKLRGFRIELGEVENALRACQGVDAAVAGIVGGTADGSAGEPRLVGWVATGEAALRTPEEGEPSTESRLREALLLRLPAAMVPSRIVELPELPLTANGKIDRRALPAPEETSSAGRAGGRVEPRDRWELVVQRVFERVLGRSPVELEGDFFELGGHSLAAVRAVDEIARETGRMLPLRELFEVPTAEGLAERLASRRSPGETPESDPESHPESDAVSPLVRLTDGVAPPLFLVHPAGGSVLGFRHLARELAPRSVWAFEAAGLEGTVPPRTSVEALATAYLDRLPADAADSCQLGGWSMGGLVAFEMARRLEATGVSAPPLLLLDTRPPDGEGTDPPSERQVLAGFARELEIDPSDLEADDPADRFQVLQEAGVLPEGLTAERARSLYAVYRANVRAMTAYRARPYNGEVLLMLAREGLGRSESVVAARWAPFAPCLHTVTVDGGHLSLLSREHAGAVAQRILSNLSSEVASS